MMDRMDKPDDLIPLTLTPVEVFGGCFHPGCHDQCGTWGYGLMDAIGPGYSDCNRATGMIYRMEDIDSPEFDEGRKVRVTVWVRPEDRIGFFTHRFGMDLNDPATGRLVPD